MKVTKIADTTPRDKAGEKLIITKDHTIKDVLKYHKEGYSLHFDGSEDDFIDLSDKDLALLPKGLMVYYITALKERQGRLKDVVNTIALADTPGRTFGYDRRASDPTDQLEVSGVKEGMVTKWVRAYDDQIKKAKRKGYRIARGSDAVTFDNDGTTSKGHYVGSESNAEMVLMITSEKNFKLNEERIKRKSNKIKEAAKGMLERSAEGLRGSSVEMNEI